MNRLLLLAAAAAILGPAAAPTRAQDDQLVVVQDESSMEQTIERYLKANHQLVITEKHDGDDLWLELPMKGGPMPGYRITIDTQSLNKDPSGRVLERGVRLQALTGIKVPEARRGAVLRLLNDFNRDKVFSAVYLDNDEEIVLDWTLNVLAPGLATEYVYDAVYREDKLWRELYPLVMAALR
ncbi:MAG TPA: YbjN domain-containing protein [Opitutaceae bacterium]|nr:YbjN domain-containing protein [Opitutaceae bacterium]